MEQETVVPDVFIATSNNKGKIIQPIRITIGLPANITMYNQFNQFRWTSISKPIEKTKVEDIFTIKQGFKRGKK